MSERKLVPRYLNITDLDRPLKLSDLVDELKQLNTPDKIRPYIEINGNWLQLCWLAPESDEEPVRDKDDEGNW